MLGLCIKTHFDPLRAKCFDTIFGSGVKLVLSQIKYGSKICDLIERNPLVDQNQTYFLDTIFHFDKKLNF